MFSRFIRPAIAALAFAAGPAMATTTLDVSAPNLFANGGSDVTISYAPTSLSERVHAGQFNLVARDMATNVVSTVQVYCTDIFDRLIVPATYTVGLLSDNLANATKVGQINALLSHANAAVMTSAASAGLQLAIWEVQNEAGTTAYDLGTGQFQASNTDAATLAAAAADLAHINDASWAAAPRTVVSQLEIVGGQRLSYLTAVPEPGTMAILGAGLLMLGLRLRLRARG